MSGSSRRAPALFIALILLASPHAECADGDAASEPALDPAVLRGFRSMMENVRYGFSESEEAAFVVRDADGAFSLVPWTPSGLPDRGIWAGRFPAGVVAIAHTHPNWVPMPSRIDARTARRTGLAVYVVTRFTIVKTGGGDPQVIAGGEWYSRVRM